MCLKNQTLLSEVQPASDSLDTALVIGRRFSKNRFTSFKFCLHHSSSTELRILSAALLSAKALLNVGLAEIRRVFCDCFWHLDVAPIQATDREVCRLFR